MLNRQPFSKDAYQIFNLAYNKEFESYISSASVTDIFYLAKKTLKDIDVIYKIFDDLKQILHFASVDSTTINESLIKRWNDFEDCVQDTCADQNNCEIIVTRNESDFSNSKIKVMSPKDFLSLFN